MKRNWWTFQGFVDEREEELLRKRFLDTCNHEGGHLLLGADLATDAVKDVRVDQPKQGETFEGVTGVDLRRVAPDVVPLVALAGCMTEAKRGAEQLFRVGATTPAFFCLRWCGTVSGTNPRDQSASTAVLHQIGHAAGAFEQQRNGHVPQGVVEGVF